MKIKWLNTICQGKTQMKKVGRPWLKLVDLVMRHLCAALCLETLMTGHLRVHVHVKRNYLCLQSTVKQPRDLAVSRTRTRWNGRRRQHFYERLFAAICRFAFVSQQLLRSPLSVDLWYKKQHTTWEEGHLPGRWVLLSPPMLTLVLVSCASSRGRCLPSFSLHIAVQTYTK